MLKHIKNATLAIVASTTLLFADGGDYFDIKAGMGSWSVGAPTGQFGNSSSSYIDLTNDFGIEDGTANYLWAEFQHPIPLIPHIRVEYAKMPFSGTSTTTFTFGPYTFDTNIKSDLLLDNVDAIFFYDVDLFDERLDLNFGVGAKVIVGQLTSIEQGTGLSQTVDIGAPAVYVYLNGRFELFDFVEGLGIELEYKKFPGSDSVDLTFTEQIFKVDYTVDLTDFLRLGVEAGMRTMDLTLDMPTDSIYINVGLDGTFAGAFVKLEI